MNEVLVMMLPRMSQVNTAVIICVCVCVSGECHMRSLVLQAKSITTELVHFAETAQQSEK